LQKRRFKETGRRVMPITSHQVNEASGSSEANVARDRTARTGGAARPGAAPAKSYKRKEGQPDPTKSVEDERSRRARGAPTPRGAPKVTTKGGRPSSKAESESDKTWSRAGQKNQEGRARR
jgi:hypothetical protein